MSAYIRALQRDHAAEMDAKRLARESAAAQAAAERLAPLEQRLARLLTTIPLETQQEGLSLAVLQASLRGRHRGSCHPGELGRALRKLGFKRERRWRADAGFAALWRKGR
jgi:hypothetical protein